MYLSNIKIWNFRKFGTNGEAPGLDLNFNKGLNMLIGENDSGKTAIIDAIKHVLLTQSKEYLSIDEYDFFKPNEGDRTEKLKIECVFSGFDDEGKEAGHFLEWIGYDDEGKYELIIRLTAEIHNNRVITDIKSGADNEGIQLDGRARDLLRATYLKPLRDAEAELTPGYKSRLAQILKSHPIFDKAQLKNNSYKKDESGKEIHPLEDYISTANESIKGFFTEVEIQSTEGANKIKAAKEIRDDINDLLIKFFPDGEISNDNKNLTFSIASSDLNAILQKLSLSLEENKSGLGSLNLLFIATELLLMKVERIDSLKLILIEEIEAHLHAQAQLRLIEYFKEKQAEQQVILTTHSNTLASKISLENLIICKDDKAFTMDSDHTQLENGDYKFLERFLDATKANLFFARGVIIVEGDAENLLIPTIAEIIGKPLHKHGVSIVNVGSTAFKRYAKIFLRRDKDSKDFKGEWLGIPVSIITDKDEKAPEDISKISREWNKQNTKIYLPDNKTLEYDIFKSELKEELIKSAIIANKIKNAEKRGDDYYKELKDDNDKFKIPKEVNSYVISLGEPKLTADYNYDYYFKGKNASKAVTAEIFSEIIQLEKENVKAAFLNEDINPLKYITAAITHATNPISHE